MTAIAPPPFPTFPMFYDWRDTQTLGRYAWHYGADVHLAQTPWSDPVLVDLSAVVQPGHALPPTLAQHPAFSLYATVRPSTIYRSLPTVGDSTIGGLTYLDVVLGAVFPPSAGGELVDIAGLVSYTVPPVGVEAAAAQLHRARLAFRVQLAAPVAQTVHPIYLVAPVAADTPLPAHGRVHDLVVDVTATHIGSVVPAPDWSLVPARLGLAGFIGDAHVADCTLQARDAPYALHVSRVMLARASPYFRDLFSTSTDRDITLTDWSAPAVALAVIHMYAGWVPPHALPDGSPSAVVRDFACDPAGVKYATWRHLFDLAHWLGLKQLALAANRQCAAVLDAEFREVEMEEEPQVVGTVAEAEVGKEETEAVRMEQAGTGSSSGGTGMETRASRAGLVTPASPTAAGEG
ncbi:hypothetical protein AMAG_09363 [Allomyces macrogynus ATCC 38327]|uniref:BTB domain-containing protein n=1 Tax=Allomyces macrogynus (strain ATCC 38327) TaxID=578462 RepID=A0A0L0SP89_ALLM3|nr:hypothetical protein AMAG_09363 [Allomyces macrogynus ATCC 38327]|eukprot:KNE64336.1 hypothetical protein AMAG_09363 [Allomyces macrogynus ATCC 38327]